MATARPRPRGVGTVLSGAAEPRPPGVGRARGADDAAPGARRRRHRARRGRDRRGVHPGRRACSSGTGATRRPPRRCSYAGPVVPHRRLRPHRRRRAHHRQPPPATSSSAAARTSTRSRSRTGSSSTPTSSMRRSSASTTATLGQVVKAFVVTREGASLTPRPRCRSGSRPASPASRCPTAVEFRDVLPYTETGKVMKHTL